MELDITSIVNVAPYRCTCHPVGEFYTVGGDPRSAVRSGAAAAELSGTVVEQGYLHQACMFVAQAEYLAELVAISRVH